MARKAVLANIALVAAAFALPRLAGGRESGFAGAAAAATLFLAPMLAALIIGVASAARCFVEAGKARRGFPWHGLAPLGIFCAGILGLLAMIAARSG